MAVVRRRRAAEGQPQASNNQEKPSDLHHYVISVAARMCGVHPQTLRHYERIGLVNPARTGGNIRLYSDEDIQRLRQVQRLIDELGVNLAGVEVIMNMTDRMERQQREFEQRLRQVEEEYQRDLERFRRIIRKMDKIATS
ncbi:MAG TPA: helix-turn-helix transcriptional regulator [Chloroflexota bacterium]|nr:helix-turn-helix transcriptional regulator [Chloroflexota bacterium]